MLGNILERILTSYAARNLPPIKLFSHKENHWKKEDLDYFGQVMSYNQSEFINYGFKAYKRHTKLKELFDDLSQEESSSDKKENLKAGLSELEDYINNSLKEICKSNFRYAISFFKERKLGDKTRICIKAVYNGKIHTIFRSKPHPYSKLFTGFPIESNTAFNSICSGQDHYICNDIPKLINDGIYKKSYYRNCKPFRNQKSDKPDIEWRRCWVYSPTGDEGSSDRELYANNETCYKSTLVVPLILTNRVGDEILDYLEQESHSNGTMLGFLCFDHQNINFFNEETDIYLAKFFADIISIYFFQNMAFGNCSSFFQNAKLLLSEET
jgi:hypothetical protein